MRKGGAKLKLQDQPRQILLLLLEHPGEIVTREEIQKRLWREDTYVDFDNAINSAVRKLRDALGDDAANPRFIETLSRQGYRFIAQVSRPGVGRHAVPETSPGVQDQTVTRAGADSKQATTKTRIWGIVGATVAAIIIMGGIGFRLWVARSEKSSSEHPAPAVPLTGNPGYEAFATFSPEGTRVAFSWDEHGKHLPSIYIKLIGPGDAVRLTKSATGDFGPAWSPDGRYVAFLRARDSFHSVIVIVPSIGGQERELADVTFYTEPALQAWSSYGLPPPFLAWSTDGKWLLSLDERVLDETASIVRVSAETGEKRTLMSAPEHSSGDGGIALSPDGKILAFARNLGANERDIYVVSVSPDMASNGTAKRVTFDSKEIEGLAWTADGNRLVFSSNRKGRRELWEVPVSPAGTPVRLTAAGDDPRDVAISREGHHLVYSHQVLDWNLWRQPLNGKATEPASSFISSTRLESHATYSSDSRRIAFESNRSGNEEIWTCDADGSNLVQLTTFQNAWAGSPRWSPDGQRIAFDGDAGGSWDIYVIGSRGGKPSRLTGPGADEFRPSWSRDGKWIYYCSTRTGHPQIWKISPAGGEQVQVTTKGGGIALESADGKDIYYTREESELWKMAVGGGPETKVMDSLAQPNFAPTKHGVYFTDSRPVETGPGLKFLDFASRAISTVAILPGPVGEGISVSPDERWMLFDKPDRQASELMVIENFR